MKPQPRVCPLAVGFVQIIMAEPEEEACTLLRAAVRAKLLPPPQMYIAFRSGDVEVVQYLLDQNMNR